MLATEAQGINFIDPRPDPADSTVKSPAGYYMNMIPRGWRVSDDAVPQTWWNPNGFGKTNSGNACTPGSTTEQGWWYDDEYTMLRSIL